MSIIHQHTADSLSDAWRLVNIDALIEDSTVNFDVATLSPPPQAEITEPEVRQVAGQVRQLLRGGDTEGALRGCLEMPVYNGADGAKVRLDSWFMPLYTFWLHALSGYMPFMASCSSSSWFILNHELHENWHVLMCWMYVGERGGRDPFFAQLFSLSFMI